MPTRLEPREIEPKETVRKRLLRGSVPKLCHVYYRSDGSCYWAISVQKDGQQLPGKKGISLPADQFHKLQAAHDSLTEALEAQDASFEVALSGK